MMPPTPVDLIREAQEQGQSMTLDEAKHRVAQTRIAYEQAHNPPPAEEWALEGAPIHECHRVPGKLYASHPPFATREEAEEAFEYLVGRARDGRPVEVRLLVRRDGGDWEVVS